MCDASTRRVNFGAFLNFLQKTVWFRVYILVGTLRSKKDARTSLGF